MFSVIKNHAKEIYKRDKWYLWRLLSIVIALYLLKSIVLALFSWLPLVTYKLLDAALAIVYIPFGVSIAHMLIHE